MAKRLTDCGKWDDPWFHDLPNEYKLLWIYVLDKCDHAGIWKVNKPLAEFMLRSKPSWDDFLQTCDERIVVIPGGKWFIPKFISFQYGVLSSECRPHKPVIEILEKMKLKGYLYPIDRDKEQYKEKEQEQEKGIVKGVEDFNQLEAFETVWNEYPVRGRLKRSASLRLWCEIAVNRDTVSRVQKSIKNYAEHLKANDWKLPQEFPNWLEAWPDWENYKEPGKPGFEKKEKKASQDCTACGGTGKLPDGKRCWCWS